MAKATGENTNLKNQLAATKNNQLAKTPEENFQGIIKKQLARQFKAIESLVPKHVTPERLARVGLNAISRNPKLMECSPDSIVGSIVNCASLGLEPNLLGHAYIVPFYNGKTRQMEAQFQVGYKGAIDLIRRTGEVSRIYAHSIHENDEFTYELGVSKNLIHKPLMLGDRGEVLGYYAVYHLRDGGSDFIVMTKDEIINHMKKHTKSKSKDGNVFGPWKDHFDEMAKKTCILKLIKYMPISIEQQEAKEVMEGLNRDNSVINVKEDVTGVTNESFLDADYVTVDEEDLSGTPYEEK